MKKIKIYIAVISGLFCCLFAYSLFSLLAGGTPSPCLGEFESAPVQLKLISSGQVHPGFGVENSLDGDPNDDYTAFYENSRHQFTLEVIPEVKVLDGTISFLDSENYASDWKVEARDKNNQLCASFQTNAATSQQQSFQLSSEKPMKYLLFSFSGFAGQQRLLMRELVLKNSLKATLTNLDFSTVQHKPIKRKDKSNLINLVSIAPLGKDLFIIPTYSRLWCFNRETGNICVLSPDFSNSAFRGGNTTYVPTGVATDSNGDVYLANYKGNNILKGKVDLAVKKIIFTHSYSSPQTGGPENVAIDSARDFLVSANYDAGTVTAFRISDGTQLWSTPVGQAHGIAIKGGHVYATSLMERKIIELDFNTGKQLQAIGGIGWQPNKYLWPTSIAVMKNGDLIVADAHTGYVYILDADTLRVKTYFGGNGPTLKLFNYPYAAIPVGDEIIVLSALRVHILFLDSDLKIRDSYILHENAWPDVVPVPFGRGWDGYIDKSPSDELIMLGKTFRPGFCHLHGKTENELFFITDYNGLYGSGSYFYFTQARQLGDVAMFFSSSARVVLTVHERKNLPPLMLRSTIPVDAWLTENAIISHSGEVITLPALRDKQKKEAEMLFCLMEKQHRLTKEDIYAFIFKKGLWNDDRKKFEQLFNNTFMTEHGRTFLAEYNAADNDLEKIQAAGRKYFSAIADAKTKNLSEFMLVGMLSGVRYDKVKK